MKVLIASDHVGFALKSIIFSYLLDKHYDIKDIGPFSSSPVDYPDYAESLCNTLLQLNSKDETKGWIGIIICGTGIGMSIAANKIPGIRCALCHNDETAKLAIQHNGANVIAFGAKIIAKDTAINIVDTFLNEKFSKEERHYRRIQKIYELEIK